MSRRQRIDPANAALVVSTLLALVAFLLANGCAGWSSPPPVSVAGSATNAATAVLGAIEALQGDAEIAAGRDPERTVTPRWEPFWAGWRIWIAAQRGWADAVERGASDAWQAEEAARAALCAAREVLPPEVPREVIAGIGIACVLLPSAPAVLPSIARDAGADGGPDAG